jgi:type I thyroxine 5'-deiodinase
MESNEKENIVFENPKHFDERTSLAGTCAVNLGIEFPALVDTIENTTEIAYTAWPDRLYVVDNTGRVAYKSDAGPFGFKTDRLSEALRLVVQSGPRN